MNDDTPTSNKARVRRQPPVPLTLAVFLASVVGFMVVVTGLFALLRYLGRLALTGRVAPPSRQNRGCSSGRRPVRDAEGASHRAPRER